MSNYTVIYDSCVLYPAPLRDLLMHLALTDLYRARWTEMIHDEWTRNVAKDRPDLKDKLIRTRELMNENVRDCLVTGYEDLIPALDLPDQDDRHVLAAAIRGSADAIVTFNLKDFPADYLAKYEVEPIHPDEFIVNQLGLASSAVCGAAKRHRATLKNPPKNVEEYLQTLERQGLPQTVAGLRYFAELI